MYACSVSPIWRHKAPNVIVCPPGEKARSASLRILSSCERIPCATSIHGHFSFIMRFITASPSRKCLISRFGVESLLVRPKDGKGPLRGPWRVEESRNHRNQPIGAIHECDMGGTWKHSEL